MLIMQGKMPALLLLLFFGFGSAEEVRPEIAEGVSNRQDLFSTGTRPGVSCYRIPSIVTAPNGDLVAAIDERVESCKDLHLNRDINIVLRRSGDNGETWTDIETVADYPDGRSASDPSMIVDRDKGEILLFYNYMDLDSEPGIYYLHVMRSRDDGRSWSEAEDLTPQIAKPEWRSDFKFITSGRGIQTRSGTLLHTMVNLQKGLHVFGSRDHGETWFLIDTSIEPADESKIVELADGSWMINSRLNDSGLRYVHRSRDQGKTWETRADPTLIDPGCNASLIRFTSKRDGFEKNRLIFSNAKSEDARRNMTVRLSYDEGKSWTEGKTIYSGPSAYSSLTVLGNGEIGLFFERDGYAENTFVRFSLEWLTDGEDRYEPPASP